MSITETFKAQDYRVKGKEASKIKPGHFHRVVTGYKCPRCGTVGKSLKNLESNTCAKCGLVCKLEEGDLVCTAAELE